MIVLDSSIWIAFINENDSQHKKAQEVFEVISIQGIILPDFIYSEVLTVLRLRVSHDACMSFISLIKEMNIEVSFFSEFFHEANLSFFSCESKLSFVDSFLVVLNKNRYQVITFDRVLDKLL